MSLTTRKESISVDTMNLERSQSTETVNAAARSDIIKNMLPTAFFERSMIGVVKVEEPSTVGEMILIKFVFCHMFSTCVIGDKWIISIQHTK